MYILRCWVILVALSFTSQIQAQSILAYWNFNSTTPDGSSSTGDSLPVIGNGSLVHYGTISKTYASGIPGSGQGTNRDTVSTDNTGYNSSSYPSQGTNPESEGIGFMVNTTGKSNIQILWSQRHSNTSSRFVRLQYTTNGGSSWNNYSGNGTDTAGLYRASNGGDFWYNRSADLSGISAVNNNANFGFRIVTAYEPGTSNYVSATTTTNYATTGTLRYDAVSILEAPQNFVLQILHASDMESSSDAVFDAPNFAAVLDTLEGAYPNTLRLASGDCYIPSPFLSAGEDPSITTHLRSTASAYYAGSNSGLRAAIGRVDMAMMNVMGFQGSAFGNHEFDLGTSEVNSIIGVDIRSGGSDKRWIGAQFPYLSANLDFSQDANLAYLVTPKRLSVDSFRTPVNITNNNQKKGIAPSAIVEVNGEKIGIVGATTQILASISSPGNTKVIGPAQNDMNALAGILQPVIDSLRQAEGINKIVLMSHLQQLANEEALAPLLSGVDIIIAGGSHSLCADGTDRLRAGNTAVRGYPILSKNKDNEPLAILNTTSEWKYVGRFVASFDQKGVLRTQFLDSNINGAYAADSQMVTSLWGNYADAFATGTKGANIRTLAGAIGSVISNKDGLLFGKSNVFLEGRRNFVRTEETNLGNVSADANLWMARQYDSTVSISIKNGGGIRSAIGEVFSSGNSVQLRPTAANPLAGKQTGDISRLDIENSLRFNNKLAILTLNVAGVKRIVEHGISATRPGATPGQFPQIGGIAFSYDSTMAAGNKIRSLVITDTLGKTKDTLVMDWKLYGDTSRTYKIVTLDFLAGGGDNYPFPANSLGRINLDTAIKDSLNARFAGNGSEQDAFAEYMLLKHSVTPYQIKDTSIQFDTRIQLLNVRADGIFPNLATISQARQIAAPEKVLVKGIVTRAWGRFIYIQDATAALAVRQSSGDMVNAILNGDIREGDSVLVFGPRNDFNNYIQIQLSSGIYNDNNFVKVLNRNNSLPTPQTLTLNQIASNGEQYESQLIRVSNLKTTSTGNWTASTNYYVFHSTSPNDSMLLRVISGQDTEAEDTPSVSVPKGEFLFEGILGQFCSTPSCTTGYQLYVVRKKDVQPLKPLVFSLVAPATNTRIVTKSGSTTAIVVNWNTSKNATHYRWLFDASSGNFSNPWLALNSSNNGKDTFLITTLGVLDAFLASKSIAQGDSVLAKWTVRAYNDNDSVQSTGTNLITLVREKLSNGIELPSQTWAVYPNPVSSILHVSGIPPAERAQMADIRGRKVWNKELFDENSLNLDVSAFPSGVYFLEIYTKIGFIIVEKVQVIH